MMLPRHLRVGLRPRRLRLRRSIASVFCCCHLISSRLLQLLILGSVVLLFCYVLIHVGLKADVDVTHFDWLASRNVSALVNEHTAILVQPHKLCFPNQVIHLRLLVLVLCSPSSVSTRSTIRSTWGNRLLTSRPGSRLVFVVGVTKEDNTGSNEVVKRENEALEKEGMMHDDILQVALVDSTSNATLKMVFALQWLQSMASCVRIKFVAKVEADTFVNSDRLWSRLEHTRLHTVALRSVSAFLDSENSKGNVENDLSNEDRAEGISLDYLIMGHVVTDVPDTDVTSKRYLPPRFYPLNILPRYVSGSHVVFTANLVPLLLKCAHKTPYINLEDVYLWGLCASAQLQLELTNDPLMPGQRPLLGSHYICYFKTRVSLPNVQHQELSNIWSNIFDGGHNCDTFYFTALDALNNALEAFKHFFRL